MEKGKFGAGIKDLRRVLAKSELLCDKFPVLVVGYSTENVFGVLHYLLARNLRLTQTSLELALSYKWTEAMLVTRSCMEGTLILNYFSINPLEVEEWQRIAFKIDAEKDKDKRNKLIEQSKKFDPKAIRKKIAGTKLGFLKDLEDSYGLMSKSVHPSPLAYGEFFKQKVDEPEITRIPLFREDWFVNWFRLTSLSLVYGLKIFDTLYRNDEFKHLGNNFVLEFKELVKEGQLLLLRSEKYSKSSLFIATL